MEVRGFSRAPLSSELSMNDKKLFRAENLGKAFFGNTVLENVSFDIDYGEVFGLVGENGAGKSTLTKIVAGVYKADSGVMWFDGNHISVGDVAEARAIGIGVVFQELSLCLNLTVAENIFVSGVSTHKFGVLKRKQLYAATEKFLAKFNVDIKPGEKVARLDMGNRQIVEILKALAADPKLLILDEPTSSLGEEEIKRLFELIREIKKKNYSVIYISHHLNEIFEITDRVMVLRDGKRVGVYESKSLTMGQLVHNMINNDVLDFFGDHETAFTDEDIILEARGLAKEGLFEDVSFKLHRGEILGLAGIVGSGKLDLCKAMYGIDTFEKGNLFYKGKPVRFETTSRALQNKIVFLPVNRKTEGLFLRDSVQNNIITNVLKKVSVNRFLRKKKMRSIADRYMKKTNVKARSRDQRVAFLSGGNQQKVLLSKCLASEPEILFAMDPTRGIDVGSKAEIHKILNEIAGKGVAIILISSEIDEVIALSDRIIIFNSGRIEQVLEKEQFNGHEIRVAMQKKASNE